MEAGELIATARHQVGITQTELAARLGTHQSVVARWETGKTQPTFQTVLAAVSAAGLDIEVKIGGSKRTPQLRGEGTEANEFVAEIERLRLEQDRLRWVRGR
jgi:transcriptional regulator with XRE-family HTH domain